MASPIGEHLTLQERAWLLSGKCPDCGGTEFDEGFRNGVRAVVDQVMTTWARCTHCQFEVTVGRTYKKGEPFV